MDFATWWGAYPKKVARAAAEKLWRRLSEQEQQAAFEGLAAHCRYWTAKGQEWDYLPHATTFLNQRRWEDEIPEATASLPKQVNAWWTTEQGVLAKGRELGIQARPGEEMAAYKQRLVEAMRRAA